MRCALLAVALVATPLVAPVDAQTSVRANTVFLSGPTGRELATIRAGANVRTMAGAGAVRQGRTQVTLDGYIDASLLGPGRDSFPNVVKASGGARLRAAGRADAAIIADLRDGMGLNVVSRTGSWVRVRRSGWVTTGALAANSAGPTSPREGSAPPATGRGRSNAVPGAARGASLSAQDSAAARPSGDTSPAPAAAPPEGALTAAAGVAIRTAPDGAPVATLDSGALLAPVARAGGWTRVRVEGWVRDDQVVPADTALQLSLSGADLRASPERYRAAVVRWQVEFISIQKADPLRRDLRAGEQYVLARGPGTEAGLLYLAIPPALLPEVQRFKPLDVISITARVRVGRSEPAGVPVLDLISAARK